MSKIRDLCNNVTAVVFLFCFTSAASSEVAKNTHVYAMIEIDRFCGGGTKATGQFVRVAIYHSRKGKYYTYMMSTAGQTFGPEGGSKHSTLDGMDMVSELWFSGNEISYVENGTKSAGNRTVVARMGVEITADGTSCSVKSCSMEVVEAGRGSSCKYKCWPTDCEIREGPAS